MAVQVVDGAYEVTGTRFHLLSGILRDAKASRSEYEQLLRALRTAQARGATADQVAADVTAQAPAFSNLASWMVSQNGIAVATWIAALIGVIQLILAMRPTPPAPEPQVNVVNEQPTQEQIDDAVRRVVEEGYRPPEPPKKGRGPR